MLQTSKIFHIRFHDTIIDGKFVQKHSFLNLKKNHHKSNLYVIRCSLFVVQFNTDHNLISYFNRDFWFLTFRHSLNRT